MVQKKMFEEIMPKLFKIDEKYKCTDSGNSVIPKHDIDGTHA